MEQLTDEQLDTLAAELPLVKAWVAAVERRLSERLEAGVEFDHARLVPKRAIRKWTTDLSPEELLVRLTAFADLDTVAPRSTLSPAQTEKTLGKKVYQDSLAELVTQESSGTTLRLI